MNRKNMYELIRIHSHAERVPRMFNPAFLDPLPSFFTFEALLKSNNMYETAQKRPELYRFGRDLLDFAEVFHRRKNPHRPL